MCDYWKRKTKEAKMQWKWGNVVDLLVVKILYMKMLWWITWIMEISIGLWVVNDSSILHVTCEWIRSYQFECMPPHYWIVFTKTFSISEWHASRIQSASQTHSTSHQTKAMPSECLKNALAQNNNENNE